MDFKLKKNSSTVLLKVYDDDQDFVRCEYAVVKITKDLLDIISKLRKGRNELGCYQVNAFQYSCHFFAQDEFDDEQISDDILESAYNIAQDNAGVWQVEAVDMDAIETLRTDADRVIVDDYGVKWEAYGKCSGVRFDTEKISWERIDKMVLENECKNCSDIILELDEECPECGRTQHD